MHRGPAWALSPEVRNTIETKIPNRVEIESIEPRPTLDSLVIVCVHLHVGVRQHAPYIKRDHYIGVCIGYASGYASGGQLFCQTR